MSPSESNCLSRYPNTFTFLFLLPFPTATAALRPYAFSRASRPLNPLPFHLFTAPPLPFLPPYHQSSVLSSSASSFPVSNFPVLFFICLLYNLFSFRFSYDFILALRIPNWVHSFFYPNKALFKDYQLPWE